MEVVSYTDFSSHLHELMAVERLPAAATIEVTRRCPLTCAHCYNNLPMGDQAALSGELTYEEHCRLVDEIVAAGCVWVLYTGGEIFARKDFLDIYTYAKRKGLLVTLFTNGTLLTPEIADYLVEWRPFNIEITLYGRTKETYEKLTGKPGSFERCLRGIRLLQERNLPLKLKTVAVTTNKHEIQAMRQFAEEELGVEFKFDAMMSPRIDCSQSPLAVRLMPEDIVEFDLSDPARVNAFREVNARYAKSPLVTDEVYQCGGGLAGFAVDPEGRMSICNLSHFDTYDLRRGSFQDGWENFLLDVRHKKATRLTKCTECRMKPMCGMCPANGELENQDAEAPVDFLCQVSHLRALTFDLNISAHGDCEYCEGGSGHEQLMQSVRALRGRAAQNQLGLKLKRYLPVIAEQGSSRGCSGESCSSSGALNR